MTRKEFFSRVGLGATAILLPACIGGLASSCEKDGTPVAAPANVDFSLDIKTGSLSTNGGYVISNGIVVARTLSGAFLAVSAACTHEGANVSYVSGSNSFHCPRHGAEFNSAGAVTQGPASSPLKVYQTSLNGTTLRVFS